MSIDNQPLVSVLTPVYNGAKYLSECIESVLSQTYTNWDYTVVNNCSKDDTLAIAQKFARLDKRIRVVDNEDFLDVISNHNKAFRMISPTSKYCKVVSGDDWLFPECLTQMVRVAEENPTAGLIGSYQLSGGTADGRSWSIRWAELPYSKMLIPGRKIGRSQLLGGPYVFGSPTSLMYRADLVRSCDRFYPNATAEADTSACYGALRHSDFAFVHQVLSYMRIHQQTETAESNAKNAYISSLLSDLVVYGPDYLTPDELDRRRQEVLADYYRFLGISVFNLRDRKFWTYHKKRFADCGQRLSYSRLAIAALAKGTDLLLNPKQTVESALRRKRRVTIVSL
jgi:glycosyltransferase involved in cell wall biosynthesis